MVTRSVSEGPSVNSGEVVNCGEIVNCRERGVPRSRFGFPKTHSLYGGSGGPLSRCGLPELGLGGTR